MDEEPTVVHASEKSRYELRIGDDLAGVVDYRLRDGRIVITHTEVDPEKRNRGLASFLIKTALDDAKRQGLEVVPVCPFTARYIEAHPEYAKLLPES